MDFPRVTADGERIDGDEVFYWRKHPNLHGWMEQLYRQKGGTVDNFNVATVELTADDLDALERAIEEEALPETRGFFFGQSEPEYAIEDRRFIAKARDALAEGKAIFYYAWF